MNIGAVDLSKEVSKAFHLVPCLRVQVEHFQVYQNSCLIMLPILGIHVSSVRLAPEFEVSLKVPPRIYRNTKLLVLRSSHTSMQNNPGLWLTFVDALRFQTSMRYSRCGVSAISVNEIASWMFSTLAVAEVMFSLSLSQKVLGRKQKETMATGR